MGIRQKVMAALFRCDCKLTTVFADHTRPTFCKTPQEAFDLFRKHGKGNYHIGAMHVLTFHVKPYCMCLNCLGKLIVFTDEKWWTEAQYEIMV